MALWSGRFAGGPAAEMQAFSESLSTDLLMWREDIQGSRAHATMLCAVGLLEDEELKLILDGLDQVGEELAAGWVPGIDQEDVHMAVEGRLLALIGPVAGKLHTPRSRNDQVATDVRLWLRGRLDTLDAELARLLAQLDRQAGEITVLPIASKAGEPARRVLVRGRKGLKRGPLTLLPPLITHTEDGSARTPAAQAIVEGIPLVW